MWPVDRKLFIGCPYNRTDTNKPYSFMYLELSLEIVENIASKRMI